MSKWITEKLVSLLGFEDDIVINLTLNLFAEPVSESSCCERQTIFSLNNKIFTLETGSQANADLFNWISWEKCSHIYARVLVASGRCPKQFIWNTHCVSWEKEARTSSKNSIYGSGICSYSCGQLYDTSRASSWCLCEKQCIKQWPAR